ncbi:MAG: DUF357 domain-containing protein [Candidatus Thermoplasmatota archaeon]
MDEEKVEEYISKTEKALDKIEMVQPERSHFKGLAEDFLKMVEAYHEDAKHFYEEGDYVNAFACINYAHGWLDAGARLGLFDTGGDDQLFTLAD